MEWVFEFKSIDTINDLHALPIVSGILVVREWGVRVCTLEMRRVADEVEGEWTGAVAANHSLNVDKYQSLDADHGLRSWNVPSDASFPDNVKHRAVLEIDENEPAACIDKKVSYKNDRCWSGIKPRMTARPLFSI